ncbi:MAG: pyridoxamine 5'-phosphate oxidase family protein [Dysgonamonadaceae bacterium]|jgi:nitroimidazol reductase NimA-like FMN-containing flavoprotein (pyridoxamine 5'-phosphate oxidase superfamily)|nr:pyridoxamine 5'-phosphate oxidase family protein [Dysgonamonadaceae bacterium]
MKTIEIRDENAMKTVISASRICYAGFAGTDGTPYVIPMTFGYRDGIIYFHSGQEGTAIDMLAQNNRICVVFCSEPQIIFQHPEVACSYTAKASSVIAYGTVEFEEDFNKKVEALNIIMQQYTGRDFNYGAPAVANVKIWKIKVDKMTCKSFGNSKKLR